MTAIARQLVHARHDGKHASTVRYEVGDTSLDHGNHDECETNPSAQVALRIKRLRVRLPARS
jgi:hypothetical protein